MQILQREPPTRRAGYRMAQGPWKDDYRSAEDCKQSGQTSVSPIFSRTCGAYPDTKRSPEWRTDLPRLIKIFNA
jgi:hypothetical protein